MSRLIKGDEKHTQTSMCLTGQKLCGQ